MHTKFKITGFQNNRDIHHRSLDFCLSLRGNSSIQMTWWFQQNSATVEDSRPLSIKSNIKYMLHTSSYINQALFIRSMWIVYLLIHNGK